MADIVRFQVLPSPRCCEITNSSPLVVCNRPARWMPIVSQTTITFFRCIDHRLATDVPIAGLAIARRVSVVAQVVLASAVQSDMLAKAEALARLTRGVERVGGLLNLHTVTCQTGPWAASAPPGDENGGGGGL